MYNRERKEQFAEQYASNCSGADHEKMLRVVMLRMKAIGLLEDALGKDSCEFSGEEIKDCLKSKGSYSYIKELLRFMKLYSQWSTANGYFPENNSYAVVTASDVDSAESRASELFKGYKSFAEYLDRRFSPIEKDSVDNMTRAFCWLLFFGLEAAEIGVLKSSDYVDGKIQCGKKTIDLGNYPEAMLAVGHAAEQTAFMKYGKPNSYDNAGALVKCNTKKTFEKALVSALARRVDGVEVISSSVISRSGLFWRMKNTDADNAAMIATRYVYGHFNTSQTRVIKFQLRRLDQEYRAWRKTAE